MIQLKHRFVRNFPSILLNDLFKDVNSLGKFVKNIENICKKYPDVISQFFTIYDNSSSDPYSTFRGDVFEIFVEFFLKAFQFSPQIGIIDYSPWDIVKEGSSDYGIDGTGKLNGFHENEIFVTVQCKYRSNPKHILTANEDHISNFVAKTLTLDSIKNRKSQMYIFTTCYGLNKSTNEKMYENMIRVYGINEINKILSNQNKAFWESFKNSLRVNLVK